MKELKNTPVLSYVLMEASAITTAVLPGKSNDLKRGNSVDNATLRSQSDVGNDVNNPPISSVQDNDLNLSCHISLAATVTTAGAVNLSAPAWLTIAHTTNSVRGTGYMGYTTSQNT